jgi:hypothetical protein
MEIKSLDHLNSTSTGAYAERRYEQESYEKPLTCIIALNAHTIRNRYPVHTLQNYTRHLSSCTIFSKIDPVRAYHQIPAHTDNIQKTAITTAFGHFEFPCMSFGLRNCPNLSTFYGLNPTRLGLLLCLSGRQPCL